MNKAALAALALAVMSGCSIAAAAVLWLRGLHAWRYTLGQEEPDIDPRSVTLMRKNADGGWSAVE